MTRKPAGLAPLLAASFVAASCGGAPSSSIGAPSAALSTTALSAPAVDGGAAPTAPADASPLAGDVLASLRDYDPAKTDDAAARAACESVTASVKAGAKLDPAVADALWGLFARFRLSQAKSFELATALHGAILAAHDPTWGDKAIALLAVPVSERAGNDEARDQLTWWQLTAVQVLGELRYAPAIKPLVVALLTRTKAVDLGGPIRFALLELAPASEVELVRALAGSDPDYKLPGWDDGGDVGILAGTLGSIGRASGRDAILAALSKAQGTTPRTALALALTATPPDPRSERAFLDAYDKTRPDETGAFLGGVPARAALTQASAGFYDPKLLDWLLRESARAPDEATLSTQIEAEAKLVTFDRRKDVATLLVRSAKQLSPDANQMLSSLWTAADSALQACRSDVACYVALFDEPIPSSPPAAVFKQVKASWMAVIHGGGAESGETRAALLSKLSAVRNPSARVALLQAIDALSPAGDPATADALDAVVAADAHTGDMSLRVVDDAVVREAWRLRARAR